MYAHFNRFTLKLTKAEAASASHQGQCDEDVRALSEVPRVRRQLAKLSAADVRAELEEYGAWDDLAEISPDAHERNLQRILWLTAGNITEEAEEARQRRPVKPSQWLG